MCEDYYFENLWCPVCLKCCGFHRQTLSNFVFRCECGYEIHTEDEYNISRQKAIQSFLDSQKAKKDLEKRVNTRIPRDLCELEIW